VKPSKGSRYWRLQFEQWTASGLSQSAYCRQHNLSLSTFNSWLRKLRSSTKPKPVIEAVPVEFAEVEVSPATIPPVASFDPVTITLPNGIALTVPPRFDEASLKRVVTTCRSL